MEAYFDDILDLYPSLAVFLGKKSTKLYKTYENAISDDHIARYKAVLTKYKKSRDPCLRFIVEQGFESLKLPFDKMPLNSFENAISEFDFMNKNVYPENTNWLSMREKCFVEFLHTCVDKMREGMACGIVLPKIICKELLRDIPDKYGFLKDFVKNEYLPKCRNSVGLCALGSGAKMYKFLIKSYCTFYVSPEKIHKFGLQEVAKLSKELKKLDDTKTYCKDKEELIALYKKNYEDICKNLLPKYFHYIPRTPCKILAVPKAMETAGAGGYYYPRMNRFYVNTRDLKENAIENSMTLTIHETVPGHHYQYAYMEEHGLSLAKQYALDNTALVEGWALYAESLGPVTHGGVAAQLFRAVRLVVDTGIHWYGWSFEKALAYMKKYLPYTESELRTEVLRYICIPGQALAYALGKDCILKLKAKYLKAGLGDVKDFHDFLLEDGVVPFVMLQQKLDRLISRKRKS